MFITNKYIVGPAGIVLFSFGSTLLGYFFTTTVLFPLFEYKNIEQIPNTDVCVLFQKQLYYERIRNNITCKNVLMYSGIYFTSAQLMYIGTRLINSV